jgi:hypothetical protein
VQGGLLFRKFPEPWQQVLTYYDPNASRKAPKKILSAVVGTTAERPVYSDVTNALKRAAAEMARGGE